MFTIRLFGGVSIEAPDGPLTGRAAQRRPLALLAILAADRSRSVARDRLMLLLDPDSDTARARHLLRDTVYALRAAIGPAAIRTAGDELRLDRDAVECDVWRFEDALEDGDLAAAVTLRTGPFLDGFHLRGSPEFDAWAAATRERLDARCAEALEALATTADDAGAAARWWTQRLLLDPLNTRATLGLMTALAETGDVAAAIRRAGVHAALLHDELGAPPDSDVLALAERLRTDPPAPQQPHVPPVPAPAAAAGPVTHAAALSAGVRRRRPALLILALVTVAVSGVLVSVFYLQQSPGPPETPRVAVVPFRNATGDARLDVLGSMAADWITQGLARATVLEVVPASTVLGVVRAAQPPLRDDSMPVAAIARETGAHIVVHGAYYRERDELHFQAQIRDAAAGVVLHALEPVRVPEAEPLRAVEELRRRILVALVARLDPRLAATADIASQPPQYEAYRDHTAGIEHFLAREYDAARVLFERAAAADTAYTLPLVWAALARWNGGDQVGADSLARAVAASAARLPPLDDAILRSVLAWADGDWAAAYDAARRAHRAAPGSGMAAAQMATEAKRLNRPREARDILTSLDPDRGDLLGFVYYWQELAEAHHMLGEHRAELRVARLARDRFPDDIVPRLIELRALAALGRTRQISDRLDELAASPAAAFSGAFVREAAQELITHGFAAGADALLDRGLAWYAARNPSAALLSGQARLLLMRGQTGDAARVLAQIDVPAATHAAIDHIGRSAIAAELNGDRRAADGFVARFNTVSRPLINGRTDWWRAALLALRNDCNGSLTTMRRALADGAEFGIELHNAWELNAARRCDGWTGLIRPRG